MKKYTLPSLAIITICLSSAVLNANHHKKKPEPAAVGESVTVGSGVMTFKTVPGWGLGKDGRSVLGGSHGSVVLDSEGNIYTSVNAGVFVFTPSGKVLRSFIDKNHSAIHDMEIRDEDGTEYIYGARNNAGEMIKFKASDGTIVMRLKYPKKSGVKVAKGRLKPTAMAIAKNGAIYLSDGYGSNVIFKFNKKGKYLSHFGKKGNGIDEFHTPHGMTLDTRYDPNRLLICDRDRPGGGRLLHFDLNGKFIGEVVTGLRRPTAVAVQGDYAVIPDLDGQVVIIGKDNKIVSVLGDNPDPKKRGQFKTPQSKWEEGIFIAPHGANWDKKGNLYVQDWNMHGRITKLVRVKSKSHSKAGKANSKRR